MTALQPIVPVLLEKVYRLIQEKVDPPASSLVEALAKKLLTQLDDNDLVERNESDLYGAVMSLWQHLNDNKENHFSVRVFNPTLAQHGWQSTHTVVEIICPDRPFLVESVRMTLGRRETTSHMMLNGPHRFCRDKEGRIEKVCEETGVLLSVFHIEIDRLNDDQQMLAMKQELETVLADVDQVVNDWQQMRDKMQQVKAELLKSKFPENPIEKEEAAEFLNWVCEHNFTFMGYHYFELQTIEGDHQLVPAGDDGLGILANSDRTRPIKLSSLPESARLEARKPQVLLLTKGNTKSKIHRPAYTDYVGVKTFNKKGEVIGEHRFIGLYAATAYHQSVDNIPLLNNKVQRILELSDYAPESYSWKSLKNILETFPRDELFQASEKEMLDVGSGVVKMQDRDLLKIFVRRDPFGRFFSCMVYTTKERYNTELRSKTQSLLKHYFGSQQDVEFTTFFSESPLARTHYIVRVDNNNFDIDVKLLERNLMEAASSWDDRLQEALVAHFGENEGTPVGKQFSRAFPRSYKEHMLPGSAVADIQQLLSLNETNKLAMSLYRPQEESSDSKKLKLKLFHRDEPLHLSDVMPMLENLGLRVIGEAPYEIVTNEGRVFWILDFEMLHNAKSNHDLAETRDRFQDTFAGIWQNRFENDGFNQLVLNAGLSGREVSIIRGYTKYMRQVGFPFSQEYIQSTVNTYPQIAKLLVKLFAQRFDPAKRNTEKLIGDVVTSIYKKLEEVESLDDDRILRRYVEMMLATLRTNFYQKGKDGDWKSSVAFKLKPSEIPEIPAPVPAFEIFVYSPDIEGVHLRGGKVARGGLRWSDRREDFRTEILGLVKAQQVKNTVIVPVGAKGGFVCKRQPSLSTRDEIFAEGQRCYRIFIQSLLDVTDNIIDGELVPPVSVVRHDEDDPYLVVAADKGTATFSDLANEVSDEYNFWLGDAFASGGSNGYDHKQMGITAKGGWESVKRHFREIGIDCQSTDFTCIAVGDMAGDVFGNGMLLSRHIRLQAAFNHLHIFLDPNPEAESSYIERERLFKLPRSSWEDYDPTLISEGGGVFSRRSKSIPLSSQVQKMLGTRKQSMAPNDLINAILKMKADLLWNGGIGTYVKATTETHTDVGDRANDALRVNGNELNVAIVGEGGNLGLTQLARMEFAMKGGRVNTDFIDNVGGVDCSDNEVNIKILLNSLVMSGDLTVKKRNQLLESMEDEVSEIVLKDAYWQAESISVSEMTGVDSLKEQIRFLHHLEREGHIDRALEYLPDDETLTEREKQGLGLTRPEQAVLIAYAKMVLKEQLVSEEIANDPYHARMLPAYFPSELQSQYRSAMDQHPLRKEIIATCLANQMSNDMGCNFVPRMHDETGAEVIAIANAYSVAREIFQFGQLFEQIRDLDNQVEAKVQYQMLHQCRRMLRRATRWILRSKDRLGIEEQISIFQPVVNDLKENLVNYLVDDEVADHDRDAQRYIDSGVPQDLANTIARMSSLYSAMDIAQIAEEHHKEIDFVAKTYFVMGAKLSLHWFLDQINHQSVENHWQALARATFREDLDWQQRQLTASIVIDLNENADPVESVEAWLDEHQVAISRWESILAEFRVGNVHEFAKFSVAMRELVLLNLNCRPNQ
ncbi:NAD-glutamate dehydrogenase [Thaumasiovibrio subtropicus]|uniref:NAD-glutamate dehydrogenase n=1 Tax=Thaumasiovibrio subtropicus TaxID=1891207 RepID=UPI000B35EBF6|nr:NAD-glutamate dehydrogenase [Thaumasiovibrio subtropicus]